MFQSQKIKSLIGLGGAAAVAATALSGCVVSNDPNVNAAATTAVVGTAAALLFYSLSDGYYYDSDYNRMPRGYRPGSDMRIQRVNNMEQYRRENPRGPQMNNGRQMQQPQQMGNGRQMQQPQQMGNRQMPQNQRMQPPGNRGNQQQRPFEQDDRFGGGY